MKKLLSFLCAALLMGSTCIAAPVNNSTSTQSYTAWEEGYSKTVAAVKFTSAHTRVHKRLNVYVYKYDGRTNIDVYFDGNGPFSATSSDRNDYSYMVKDLNGQVWYFNL